jgi:alpha-L-fucosidase
MRRLIPAFLAFLMLGEAIPDLQAQELTNERAAWFTESRFGMFIHWGLYSGAEGYWKGEKLRFHNDYAEWIKYRNRISDEEYLSLINRFDWESIDPEQWVILAKKSGMKYLTFTAKHHDGFGLWDSQVSTYDLGNHAAPGRDVVKELAEACRKHGIKLGLYYSHWVDWEHPYGWDHSREVYPLSQEEFDQYWQEKVIPQIRELLSNYGEISMLWFDMWIHHSETIVSKEQLLQLKSLIRELQADCLVNSRLGLSIQEDPDIDYKTLGDNQIGDVKEDFPWQSPATVAHSWGFHSTDKQWKSTSILLQSLINNVSLNGNLMLNIGPRANGEVPYEISLRMLEMGRWLEDHHESIYGAGAFELRKDQHDWGRITCRETDDGFRLYLHVFNWPLDHTLRITGINEKAEKVFLLKDAQQRPLSHAHQGAYTEIDLPSTAPDPYVSVVVLDYGKRPSVTQGLTGKTSDGGYACMLTKLHPLTADLHIEEASKRGSVPQHALIKAPTTLKWQLYVDTPGEKTVDLSYSARQSPGKGRMHVRVAGTELLHPVEQTGQTVGEPNSDWIVDEFVSHRAGQVLFPEPGFYELELELNPAPGEEVRFQWIWVN